MRHRLPRLSRRLQLTYKADFVVSMRDVHGAPGKRGRVCMQRRRAGCVGDVKHTRPHMWVWMSRCVVVRQKDVARGEKS